MGFQLRNLKEAGRWQRAEKEFGRYQEREMKKLYKELKDNLRVLWKTHTRKEPKRALEGNVNQE